MCSFEAIGGLVEVTYSSVHGVPCEINHSVANALQRDGDDTSDGKNARDCLDSGIPGALLAVAVDNLRHVCYKV